ncbi:helix-turn-helix domain-containing protein [Archangium lansingense]|uniref:Helix-turn-helix domain-containing protein n=1 Tax=Archangium lansingense TaxID=2995310 RepID=A0ABT4AB14_9BACT|nr:helix-turn-helix domain-containing protein [Archangium lansinium]MCY1078868.1 helix-turn-helix domain-containing protein [Archangium lansinium]
MNDPLPTPARFSIPDSCRITGLGRSALYDRIARGLLCVVKDGHRTFISRAELERYLKACEAAQ